MSYANITDAIYNMTCAIDSPSLSDSLLNRSLQIYSPQGPEKMQDTYWPDT